MVFGMRQALDRLKTAISPEEASSRSSSPVSTATEQSTRKSLRVRRGSVDGGLIYQDDALPTVKLNGYLPTTKNKLLMPDMCDELRNLMPTRVQLYTDWQLLYSLEQHGASLRSLYDNVAPERATPMRVGYVLVIKDRKHGIFGAYTNEPFHPTENRRYYGNGECFLWKMDRVRGLSIGERRDTGCQSEEKVHDGEYGWQFRGYPMTGVNEFAIYCQSKFLSLGAGDGHYGLWVDDSLLHGVSCPSLTFGNDVLSREGRKFHIVALEVWRVG
ncbi:hypothetical protein HG536_0A01410 [Torulaspora globosa]|uniref:Oxidation resistance protein 1 n=1 Tax=Torulaspora globosa TaxID=48254 RepID=A0A7G3Z9Y8_9SACH|nr:uncharacterized protein HG536_0A01410 [Torulaspora globosa]QLL30324.1 hypothetical protein HG536_0A01410 [Torulaspora globosa]